MLAEPVEDEGDILDLPLGPLPEVDHFADIGKMILRVNPGGLTSRLGFFDDGDLALQYFPATNRTVDCVTHNGECCIDSCFHSENT